MVWTFDITTLLPSARSVEPYIDTVDTFFLSDHELAFLPGAFAERSPWLQWQWLGGLARTLMGNVPYDEITELVIHCGILPDTFGITSDKRVQQISQLVCDTMVLLRRCYPGLQPNVVSRLAKHFIAQQIWFSSKSAGSVRMSWDGDFMETEEEQFTCDDLLSQSRSFEADAVNQIGTLALDTWLHPEKSPLIILCSTEEILVSLLNVALQCQQQTTWNRAQLQPIENRVFLKLVDSVNLVDIGVIYRYMCHRISPPVKNPTSRIGGPDTIYYTALIGLFLCHDDVDLFDRLLKHGPFQSYVHTRAWSADLTTSIERLEPIWWDVWYERIPHDALVAARGTLIQVGMARHDIRYFCVMADAYQLNTELFIRAPYQGLRRWRSYGIRFGTIDRTPANLLTREPHEKKLNLVFKEPDMQRLFSHFSQVSRSFTWFRTG
jgi:hypothetical protein